MAQDREITLHVNKNDHVDRKFTKKGGTDADTLSWADFQSGLTNGTIMPTINLLLELHVGFFDSATGLSVSEPKDPLDPLVLKCVVVNVGGTVYRICT